MRKGTFVKTLSGNIGFIVDNRSWDEHKIVKHCFMILHNGKKTIKSLNEWENIQYPERIGIGRIGKNVSVRGNRNIGAYRNYAYGYNLKKIKESEISDRMKKVRNSLLERSWFATLV